MTNTNSPASFSPVLPSRAPSLVDEVIATITACATMTQLDQVASDNRAQGSVFMALAPSDKDLVRLAWRAKSAMLTMNAIPSGPVSLATGTATITGALTAVAAENAQIARTARTGRTGRRGPQVQTAAQIAAATATARAAGQRLAGYNGQIVDPGKGIGTVVVFGKATTEYDAIADRDRQALIQWSTVEAALVAAKFDADTLGEMVSMVAHLGQATKILNHSGYIARNVRNLGKARSSWIIGRVDTTVDSDTLGDRECRIDLAFDGSITLTDPDHHAANQVRAEYENRIANVLIESSDLRARIVKALVSDFGARDSDLGLYVSPYHTPRAMDLIVALRPVAARKIYASAYTDKASLSEALCDSFALDLGRLEREIATKTDGLKKNAGATLIERCERLRAECEGLAGILGSENVTGYKARIAACDAKITEGMDAASQRAANLELK